MILIYTPSIDGKCITQRYVLLADVGHSQSPLLSYRADVDNLFL